jgi:hypothetical protein
VLDVDVQNTGALVQARTITTVDEAGALQLDRSEAERGGAVVKSLRGRGARRKCGQRQRNDRCACFPDQNCLRTPATTP